MGSLIDDDVLNAFAVVAEPPEAAAEIRRRFAGLADRVSFYAPYDIAAEAWDPILRDLKAASGSSPATPLPFPTERTARRTDERPGSGPRGHCRRADPPDRAEPAGAAAPRAKRCTRRWRSSGIAWPRINRCGPWC